MYKANKLTVCEGMIESVTVAIVDIFPRSPVVEEKFVFSSTRVVVVGTQFDQRLSSHAVF